VEGVRIADKQEEYCTADLVFHVVFDHPGPRVEFLSAILRKALIRSSQTSSAVVAFENWKISSVVSLSEDRI